MEPSQRIKVTIMTIPISHVSAVDTLCMETHPEPCAFVIFGASGDLTHRKLLPSLLSLDERGLMPEASFIIGCARTPMSDEGFRQQAEESLRLRHPDASSESLDRFIRRCHYVAGSYDDAALYSTLSERLRDLERQRNTGGRRLFYLAVPPDLFLTVPQWLHRMALTLDEGNDAPWRRVILEKPLGRDLQSAMHLDVELHRFLSERQIWRIDHYLGKDTVQNILMLRFANSIFEPVWSRQHIDHVQITVAESVGIEHRAGYFEQTGILRDMFQNHMLQMLSLVAEEAPTSFDADRLRDERVKLLRSVRPFPTDHLSKVLVRGQYGSGTIEGQTVKAYREEPGVDAMSKTETFIAATLFIDNWRWYGVPFYLRVGKRLSRRTSEIAITLKNVPHSIFRPLRPEDLAQNVLVMNVQPDEGISLTLHAKKPGPKLCMAALTMDFCYRDVFGTVQSEAYDRLILDAMLGDQSLFVRSDEVETAWRLVTPILEAWESGEEALTGPLYPYEAGSWGPAVAHQLIDSEGRSWRMP